MAGRRCKVALPIQLECFTKYKKNLIESGVLKTPATEPAFELISKELGMTTQACYLSIKRNIANIYSNAELFTFGYNQPSSDDSIQSNSTSMSNSSYSEGVKKIYKLSMREKIFFTPYFLIDKNKKMQCRLPKGWTTKLSFIIWKLFKKQCSFTFKNHAIQEGELYCSGKCKECENFINVSSANHLQDIIVTFNCTSAVQVHYKKTEYYGTAKTELSQQLQMSNSRNVRDKIILENMAFGDVASPIIPTYTALKQSRYDNNKQDYFHHELFKSLKLLNEKSCYRGSLRAIGFDPFYVVYWLTTQEDLYQYYKTNERIVLSIDATGSVVQSPHGTGYPFLYTICLKPKQERSFNVAHFISTNHEAEFIAFMFFKQFLKYFALPKEINLDESPGLIAAVVKGFTASLTLKEYLSKSITALNGELRSLPKIYIRLDVAHFVKTIKRVKVMKKMSAVSKNFYLRAVGFLIICDNFDEARNIIKDIFTVLLNKFESLCVMNAKQRIVNLIKTHNIVKEIIEDDPSEENQNAEFYNDSDQGREDDISLDTNWIFSIIDGIHLPKEPDENSKENDLFFTEAKTYFIKLFARLPLWSGVMRKLYKSEIQYGSSAAVENSFKDLKISVCDDYSLPVDFVKKRPSSFDPCLAERIPDNWASPSPLSEHVTFLEQLATVQQAQSKDIPNSSTTIGLQTTLSQGTQATAAPLTNLTPIKLVEGYSDPRDTKTKVKHRRRLSKDASNLSRSTEKSLTKREYSHLYSSDSSAPKSSEDEDNNFIDAKLKSQIPELNSPDSISEDLVKPLHSIQNKSPKRLTTSVTSTSEPSQLLLSNNSGNLVLNTNSLFPPSTTSSATTAASKRNPSPYYYSDLLKGREQIHTVDDNENSEDLINKSNQLKPIERVIYRKSNSLDTPIPEKEEIQVPKRYSITEDGVRIIRCDSPSTTTSDDSDCTECQKRRDWHAKALALVRDSCNIIPKYSPNSMPPHRFLGPAVCACAAPDFGDDHDEQLFRPRSIFYVHQQGADECADCTLNTGTSTTTTTTTNTTNYSIDNNKVNNLKDDDDDMSGIGSGGGGGGHGSGGSSGKTRQIYETAFDCKIMKSDDDLDDDLDRLTNHSILLQLNNGNSSNVNNLKMVKTKSNQKLSTRIKNNKQQQQLQQQQQQANNQQPSQKLILNPSKSDGSASTLSQEMENMHLDNLNNANTVSSSQLPLRGYTPSPPSTAPLPVKFPGKHERYFIMNSIKSAPNLPSSQAVTVNNQINNQMNSPSAQHPRLRELRLPIGDSRSQNDVQASDDGSSSMFIETGPPSRPRSVVLESSRVLELKRSHHSKISHPHHGGGGHHGGSGRGGRKNYSSTESMATSSSGGSMESLRSSTSEGNRSTSSSESHHSTSLSSHSSDSGPSLSFPLRAPVLIHSKLHILSPISDKSSQEPGSETSDINNRNNNSQKVSPDEIITTVVGGVGTHTTALFTTKLNSNIEENDNSRVRKRIPQNKNLLTVKGDEIQGSDSGISLHSRDESKRSAFTSFGFQKVNGITAVTSGLDKDKTDNNTTTCLPQDLNDLPFDMPKLRRRKIIPQQDACTSGSATSVDLGELPFDMPKLRRRLRLTQPIASTATHMTQAIVHTSTESSGISQASSSQSVREDKAILAAAGFRQNLTLNLGETKTPRKFGTLEFGTSRGLNLNVGPTTNVAVDLIDATIPLDRQGWYHGAISRIEAENTLRPLNEGSFLVRNSESTRQDYSLSLKSAKGFMHMRIQQSAETGQYILGQFSRPFETIPEMIRHFCLNRLPVRGAEHMCLLEPVIAQLL